MGHNIATVGGRGKVVAGLIYRCLRVALGGVRRIVWASAAEVVSAVG